MRSPTELNEREWLALAIHGEAEDAYVCADFARHLEPSPEAERLLEIAAAARRQHDRLLDLYTQRFGTHVPYMRRQDVKGLFVHPPVGETCAKGRRVIEEEVGRMTQAAASLYAGLAARTTDTPTSRLFDELAKEERASTPTPEDAEAARKRMILQIVQPGLVGLMDGSVSTLAPVFAAAFSTRDPWNAFLVGLAASLGAGISMGFAEALADDGKLSGRGAPILRGLVCGLMTVAGGIGHTLPYLIKDFVTATVVAGIVVVIELLTIAWIQWRFMQTPPVSAAAKVMLGGGLVLATGILIGSG
ncbi:Rubrerythrin [Arboricoccus pini]|uniref:Rubrerythrin n=1 Tax=Arboricoccus pini TaxID=1963835 RepID=A0A212S1A8_9PROT|nr:ferritin family protein [Arboricoccus pini]SNB78774.1 Rubrerythrin [Arboricoccus pini]